MFLVLQQGREDDVVSPLLHAQAHRIDLSAMLGGDVLGVSRDPLLLMCAMVSEEAVQA